MTKFLIKLFIKDKDKVQNIEVREKYGMLSSITGIIVNVLLSVFKLIIGVLANSMAIISDGLNNISDAGSSVVTMLGFKMSQKKGRRRPSLGARKDGVHKCIYSRHFNYTSWI